MKRSALMLCIALISTGLVAAGDLGNFINLGFSPDSSHFAFGSYGVRNDDLPWAEIALVNVAKNDFLPGNPKGTTGKTPVSLGQDGMASLLTLITQHQSALKSASTDFEKQGRLVYVLLDGVANPDSLSFKDFNTNTTYSIELRQKANEQGASFAIKLKVTPSTGAAMAFDIGRPNLVRKGVKSYLIRQVILAPNERSLVFVIEKNMDSKSAVASEFMVETVAIQP